MDARQDGAGGPRRDAVGQSELRTYRKLARALRSLPPLAAPAGLGERALARIAAGTAGPRSRAADGGLTVGEAIRYGMLETELGTIYLAYGPNGIRFVAPATGSAEFEAAYARRFGAAPTADAAPPVRLLANVRRALSGDRRAAARLPLDLEALGSFERAVLRKALEIPRGQVRTYGWVAREIGRPRAVRAVGRALGSNPIPFIIPCHRVVGSSGNLTGYAFGLQLKRRVLEREGIDPDALEAGVRRGERFTGCRSTRIFCFPTCHHARRVRPANVVPFRGEAEARAAGYRPCLVCRPAGAAAAAAGS